ncbi:WYL domain-containing protein [Sphingomonas sp. MG17]|uniref:WYL domain-containing protein n=1 Tax=Sphingomonas tagetis TaxID=2949092 RepID=A0A9X2HUX4_9SPHN|nr:WYL domain-containing transcriptional regulator [Sphingomonas tagetis]MCP3733115.1 WYL domain-containing protein [Sphingomonas tagetis]
MTRDAARPRMGKLRRALTLIHLLAESAEGLTLDEIAAQLGVNRRTAERLRDAVRDEFDVEERVEDRTKRFFIRDRLGRAYTRPSAEEVAALEIEVAARLVEGAGHAAHLDRLLAKVKSALDDREKRKLAPDLDALVRLQRSRIVAGPLLEAAPETIGVIQGAILAAQCVEFDYASDGARTLAWRMVVPYGLLHGPTTYLIGKIPDRDQEPVFYRLDRMIEARIAERPGLPPDDWDPDAWLARSFGIWREEHHEIVLRVAPSAAARARQWRFHPGQTFEDDGDKLLVRFRAGGLREVAEHLFTWGGDIRIEAPEELRAVMRERVLLALGSV